MRTTSKYDAPYSVAKTIPTATNTTPKAVGKFLLNNNDKNMHTSAASKNE